MHRLYALVTDPVDSWLTASYEKVLRSNLACSMLMSGCRDEDSSPGYTGTETSNARPSPLPIRLISRRMSEKFRFMV